MAIYIKTQISKHVNLVKRSSVYRLEGKTLVFMVRFAIALFANVSVCLH